MPSTKPKIVIHTEDTIIKKLDTIATAQNRSRANLVETIIKEWLEKYEKQNGNIIIQNNSHFGDININK